MEENAVKEKILSGAEELFMRFGIRSLSMDDLARHLGMSKKTLYQHVPDKDELVLLVARSLIDRNKALAESIRKEARNPVEELAKISTCIRSAMESLNPSVLFDLQKFHQRAWNAWLDFKRGYLRESIVRLLKQGIEEGYIREDIDPEVMASMRIELVQLAFNSELFSGNRYSLSDLQEQLYDHFVYGLVTDKGRKLYQKYKSQTNQSITIL
ncbi:MAG: TetR/AcrR family transcriptional regulator [Cyclobacteriaceae bacterium]|nr:TetR/AcrR family transcriptional regulator [Cyclobacteriaceae bacterium]MDW8331789.1 TetR/AcrR family transcriptional regulator [Cyclobacteriaceae bacterium]